MSDVQFFTEHEGETTDATNQRWLNTVLAHPDFEKAARMSMRQSLARYDRTPLMSHISKDIVRMFYGYFALSLDARGGLTLSAMQQLCKELGISSPGRAHAMMIHMRMIGFITPNPDASNRRVKPYIPTPSMEAAFREVMIEEVQAFALLNPRAADLPRLLADRDFFKAYLRAIGEGLTNLIRHPRPNAIAHFANRNGGMLILYKICESAAEEDCYPPRGPVRISVAGLSKQYGVSRSHVLKLLRDAEALGYLRRDANEQTGVIEEPLRHSLREGHAAAYIGIARCWQKALKATGAMAPA